MRLNAIGEIESIGVDPIMPFEMPAFISQQDFYLWQCIDVADINSEISWIKSPPSPTSMSEVKQGDIRFGESLLLEFLTGQKDITLDNATYRSVSETFKYAEAALRRGDIPQAKTELTAIAPSPPVWTQEAKDYFIAKINTYLGL